MKETLSMEEDKSEATSIILVSSSMQKRSKSSSSTQQHLPHEILEDILVRLSAHYLSRTIYYVCPSWRALISDTLFVKSHLRRSTIVGFCQIKNSDNLKVYNNNPFISLTMMDPKASNAKTSITSYPFNFTCKNHRVKILGSCDGMILVCVSSITLLWNPTTNERVTLDTHPNIDDDYGGCISGLGYDSSLDEYKAVVLTGKQTRFDETIELDSNLFICRTRGTPLWNEMNHAAHELGLCNSVAGSTFNGSPHWLLNNSKQYYSHRNRIIVYFDMVVEKLKTITIPSSSIRDELSCCNITVLNGCLIFTSCSYFHKPFPAFNVWAMKEYGVTESWTKLFSIQRPFNSFSLMPLGFINNGDEIVLRINGMEKIVAYNLQTCEEKIIMSDMVPNYFQVRYEESLVSPNYCIRRRNDC